MNSLFVLLIKASLSIALFYSVYWFFLRKETFFKLNRLYLVFTLLVSLVLPVFPVNYEVIVQPGVQAGFISAIGKRGQVVSGLKTEAISVVGWREVLFAIYLTGAFLFLLRLIIQSLVIARLITKCRIKKIDGLKIVENEKYGLPFSFFKLIFINPKFHKEADLNDIMSHERVHLEQDHWIDLLIIELLTVIFWFNPFIWLFEYSIKQNHEYLADQGALTRGSDLSRYQALLINQLMGMQIIGVTSNLNFALNTNRLKMMTKMQSKKIHSIKLLLALPVVFLLMTAFAEPVYKTAQANEETNNLSSFSLGKRTFTVKGKVQTKDGTPLPGTSIIIKGMTIGTTAGENGEFKLDIPENDKFSLVASYVGYKTDVTGPLLASKDITCDFTLERELIGIDTRETDEPGSPPPPPVVPGSNEPDAEKEVFIIVEEMPEYPGGQHALVKYYLAMKKKVKDKFEADGKKLKGKALMGFTVDENGSVTNIRVIEEDNDAAAKAARVILVEMKNWKPGKQRGKAVPVDFEIPIDFD